MPDDFRNLRLAFLASHNGTSCRILLERNAAGTIAITPVLLISNNSTANALAVAARYNVPTKVINGKALGEDVADQQMCEALLAARADIVILAGYMRKIGPKTLGAFEKRIINSHPALLPAFGGQGMYGRHVHEAVLAAGAKKSGVTIHFTDKEYDTGPLIVQKSFDVSPNETVESLEEKAKALEPEVYIEALRILAAR